jgi:putative NIF3 family GTP cyclohydrolase 1 type 2
MIINALRNKADVYVTADLTYHDFFEPDGQLLLADIGHFESEQYTSDLLERAIKEKVPTFAVLKTGRNTNPVNYFL